MPSHTEEEKRKERERKKKLEQEQRVREGLATPTDFVRQREKLAGRLGISSRAAARQITAGIESGIPERERRIQLEREEEEATALRIEEAKPGLTETFEEAGVFKTAEQGLIIPPEKEQLLGVTLRIFDSIIPQIVKDRSVIGMLKGGFDKFIKEFDETTITSAEITMIEEDLKLAVIAQTSVEINTIIDDTTGLLIEQGLIPAEFLPPIKEKSILAVAGGAVAGQAILRPVSEFIGTDGQIRSLELALSQYNEMITIPARSIASGLPPELAFEQYNRMEESLLALEEQLQISSLTSPKVALALRGRGIEARLLKLKKKLQEGREIVALKMTQEAFGEVDIPTSIVFLRQLQLERAGK